MQKIIGVTELQRRFRGFFEDVVRTHNTTKKTRTFSTLLNRKQTSNYDVIFIPRPKRLFLVFTSVRVSQNSQIGGK